jgi:hypothetical protein
VYGVWTPPADLLDGWRQHLGQPARDGSCPRRAGRAVFYQNFVLGMIESRLYVGWHWFKYRDNDPDDLTTDPSDRKR